MAIGYKEVEVGEEKLVFISCFLRFGNITFSLQNCLYTYEINFMQQRRIPSEKRFIVFGNFMK